jgi:hypothetical protein
LISVISTFKFYADFSVEYWILTRWNIFRRTMGFLKPQLEKDGFKETQPDLYDLRDWDEIRNWAKELANKA